MHIDSDKMEGESRTQLVLDFHVAINIDDQDFT